MNPSKSGLGENLMQILKLVMRLDLRGLLLAPTDNGLLQFFRYCLVGAAATVVDCAALFLTEKLGLYYLAAAGVGFLLGLCCNYGLSKFMVFNGKASVLEPKKEFLAYAVIGAAGLLLTLALMYIMTEWLKLYFMLSKLISTVLVLLWNYAARRLLYK